MHFDPSLLIAKCCHLPLTYGINELYVVESVLNTILLLVPCCVVYLYG